MTDSKISLFDLAMAFSDAADLIDPVLYGHHKRVACAVLKLSDRVGMTGSDQKDLILAALLHDTGALSLGERLALKALKPEFPHSHTRRGGWFLSHCDCFKNALEPVLHHHVNWEDGRGETQNNTMVTLDSHLLHLANRIVSLMDPLQDVFIQKAAIIQQIRKEVGTMFHPECSAAFMDISREEHFWLEISSDFANDTVSEFVREHPIPLETHEVMDVGECFSRVIDFRSRYTCSHSRSVSVIAEKLAQLTGMGTEDCAAIRIAGYFHDLGKLAVPAEIINNRNRLSDDDFGSIRKHSYYTYRILRRIKGLDRIAELAGYHHERLDGSGYPFHLKKDELSLGACLIAVADVFTALVEDRPYRKGLSHEETIQILTHLTDGLLLEKGYLAILTTNFKDIYTLRKETLATVEKEFETFQLECGNAGIFPGDAS